MRKIIFVLTVAILAMGCHDKEKIKRIRIRQYTLEGDISKDTILNGLITYYNLNNQIVTKTNFVNNIQNGISTNYYLNGSKKNEINFFYGKENGIGYEYDSLTGKVSYKNFFFFGKLIGPECTYYPDGNIEDYFFLNFEGETIFYSHYDSLGIPTCDPDHYFQMRMVEKVNNNEKGHILFIYNLQPPNFKFKYKICIEDSTRRISSTVDSIPEQNIFFERFLPDLIYKNRYCIVLTISDSINNRARTLIREIINTKGTIPK